MRTAPLACFAIVLALAAPAQADFDFSEAEPYLGPSCLYDSGRVPPPLAAVQRTIEVPGLGPTTVTAWLEPCLGGRSRPGRPMDVEVLAMVHHTFPAPVSSYQYRIEYKYTLPSRYVSGTLAEGRSGGPQVSELAIPLRFLSTTDAARISLTINGVELEVNNTLPLGGDSVFEFYNEAFDHYFMTASNDEAYALKVDPARPWVSTGSSWRVRTAEAPGLAPVCRFFTVAFAPKSSHFYTPDAAECAGLKNGVVWQYEGIAFQAALPDGAGNCAPGLRPLYRVYNNGMGGAPNHRYMVEPEIREAMVEWGWIPEGSGPNAVFACMP